MGRCFTITFTILRRNNDLTPLHILDNFALLLQCFLHELLMGFNFLYTVLYIYSATAFSRLSLILYNNASEKLKTIIIFVIIIVIQIKHHNLLAIKIILNFCTRLRL